MAAPRYLNLVSGVTTQVVAASAGGAGNEEKIPSLDASGLLPLTMMPSGLGPDTETIQASENLSAGDFVNVHDSTGARARKADASNGRIAHGFVIAAVTSGQNATVYFEGANTQLSSLTPGETRFLSATTPGASTATAPSTAGQTVQRLGVSVSATRLNFEPSAPVTLA